MCDYFAWDRDSKERERARDDMRHAMVLQFNDTFGTDANSLATWQSLCDIIKISPIPDKIKECRRVCVFHSRPG